MLDKVKQEEFKTILRAEAYKVDKRKCRTREEIVEATNGLNGLLVDEGELAESNHRLALNAKLCQSSDQDLKKIKLALERIENDTFGECINSYCCSEIPLARLEAVPWTDKCIKCQEAEEEKESAPRQPSYRTGVDNSEDDDALSVVV